MLFDLTEEQLLLRDTVRRFTQREIEPRDRWMDEHGFDHELFKKMHEAGFYALSIPAEYGGAGLDYVSKVIVLFETARGSASVAFTLGSSFVSHELLRRSCSKEQQERFFALAKQGKMFNFGMTEPGAGSDAAGMKCVAEPQPDGTWILNGEKAWITNNDTDYLSILAKNDPNGGPKSFCAFAIPKTAPGVTTGRHEDKMGMRGSVTGGMSFDNVRVTRDMLLGEEGKGFYYAMAVLDWARIMISCVSTGIAQHAFDVARTYANTRMAFGKPIARQEAIQFKFADMSAKLRAMKLMLFDAARMADRGEKFTTEAAQTKILCTTWATQIALDAVQILGGNGVSKEFPVERLARDAKPLEIGDGTTEILKMMVGMAVLR